MFLPVKKHTNIYIPGALKGHIRIIEFHPGDMGALHGVMEVPLEPWRPRGSHLQLFWIIMEEWMAPIDGQP
jgi:hypothetical protein